MCKLLTYVFTNTIIVFINTIIGDETMKSYEKKFWEAWGRTNALYSLWASSRNVSYYQLFVLYALDGQQYTTQKKICECTGLTKQTVNGVVRMLKNKRYIELSSGCKDKREKQLTLTNSGIMYAKELLTPLYELERMIFEFMGDERVHWMIDSLELFNIIFQKEMGDKI